MLQYKNIKIVQEVVNEYYYDDKQKKTIHYKKPIVTENILYKDKYCFDLGELYEILKFCTEKSIGTKIKVSFETDIEY